ncbi:MAG TPA: hypothetical protein VMF69_05210 [Gemmataceae bacterium]|nr:hypothetical protein [Gemmataceae bacterium]
MKMTLLSAALLPCLCLSLAPTIDRQWKSARPLMPRRTSLTDKFARIREGMTEREVTAFMGEGRLLSKWRDIQRRDYVRKEWSSGNAVVHILFADGLVIAKSSKHVKHETRVKKKWPALPPLPPLHPLP